jgi:hypothetical protein
MRSLSLSFLLILSASQDLASQWPSRVSTGARVQVRLPEIQYQFSGWRGHSLRGKVTALSADTLYLAVTDSLTPLPIPRRFIERLEYSRGVPSRGSSALRQGLISGVSTAILFLLLNEIDDDGTSAGDAALIGGGIGLTLGGISGALWPKERWKRIKLENRTS